MRLVTLQVKVEQPIKGNVLRGHEIPELAHGGTTINVVGGLVTSVTLDEAN